KTIFLQFSFGFWFWTRKKKRGSSSNPFLAGGSGDRRLTVAELQEKMAKISVRSGSPMARVFSLVAEKKHQSLETQRRLGFW
ncbi:unnamed protein product, partial [Linum tenue]